MGIAAHEYYSVSHITKLVLLLMYGAVQDFCVP